jgi:hypothetical protein
MVAWARNLAASARLHSTLSIGVRETVEGCRRGPPPMPGSQMRSWPDSPSSFDGTTRERVGEKESERVRSA